MNKLLLEALRSGPSSARLPRSRPLLEDASFAVDPHVTAYNEGKRALVLELVNELRAYGLYQRVYEERFLELPEHPEKTNAH